MRMLSGCIVSVFILFLLWSPFSGTQTICGVFLGCPEYFQVFFFFFLNTFSFLPHSFWNEARPSFPDCPFRGVISAACPVHIPSGSLPVSQMIVNVRLLSQSAIHVWIFWIEIFASFWLYLILKPHFEIACDSVVCDSSLSFWCAALVQTDLILGLTSVWR